MRLGKVGTMGKKYIVYKHTSPNGKSYIGITSKSVGERWGKNGSRYTKETTYFANAIRKHGWDNFSHDILAGGLSKKEAIAMERSLIALLSTQDKRYGFNSTAGGEGVESPPNEVRKKIGDSHSKATNQYTLDGKYVRTFKSATDAVIEMDGSLRNGNGGIGCALTGLRKTWRNYQWRYDTKDNRCQISAVYNHNPKNTKVIQYDLMGCEIRRFKSVTEAARSVNGHTTNISKCFKDSKYTAYGYRWGKTA